ncbi:MAG: oxidoreductase [Thermoleophilia bacterium]|nr:oxidoreductase [Thermoleophilia bacterium]
MATPVVVEMFLDVSCPWCHGGLETSRRVLDELAADPAVPPLALVWRFMRLHPMPREGGLPVAEYYASFSGGDPAGVEAARADVRQFARSVGVRVDESRYDFLHDPFTAHRLLAAVRDDGGDDQPSLWSLARAVFSANFVHGLDIADVAVLRGAVERSGLEVPRRTWELLADDDGHRAETLRDHDRALEAELDGVPRMLIGGRIVPTWVDPADVRRTLREAIAAAADAVPATSA